MKLLSIEYKAADSVITFNYENDQQVSVNTISDLHVLFDKHEHTIISWQLEDAYRRGLGWTSFAAELSEHMAKKLQMPHNPLKRTLTEIVSNIEQGRVAEGRSLKNDRL